MSLINRMLTDLESRRGGNLRNVDSVIDGLQPSETLARVPVAKPRRPLLLGGVVLAACAAGLLAWQPWKESAVAPAAAPVDAPAQAPPAAAQAPATPSVTAAPQAPAGSVPVVIADAPVTAPAPPPPGTAPDPVEAAPGPAVAVTPEVPEVAVEPEPAPEPEPFIETDAAPEPAPAPARASPATERPAAPAPRRQADEDSSFVIANANAPAQTAELALALIDSGRPEEAEALLREGLAVQPGDTDAARVLGHLLLGQGDARGALEVLSAAPPAITTDADYHALMAAAEQRSAEHGAAARRYRELLGVQPGNGQWLVGLGISLLATGDGPGAGDAFRQALADPALPPALRSFATQQAERTTEERP